MRTGLEKELPRAHARLRERWCWQEEHTHGKWYTGGRPGWSLCCVQKGREVAVGRGRLLVSSVGSAVVALGRGRRWSECESWGDWRRGFGHRTEAGAKRQTLGNARKSTASPPARVEDTVEYNTVRRERDGVVSRTLRPFKRTRGACSHRGWS